MNLSILYRGILKSCNYKCSYCPFHPKDENESTRKKDREMLKRFVGWIKEHEEHDFSVFFTPSGEALIKPRYQEALIKLSNCSHVKKVVIQTNLSCDLDWLNRLNRERVAFWTTFHPQKALISDFINKCHQLTNLKIKYSVGIVGLKEHYRDIERLRNELLPEIYLWINAYKDVPQYYSAHEVEFLTNIDPYFSVNNALYESRGRSCKAGKNVISVDGYGRVWPCNFARRSMGNIYKSDLEDILREQPCENEFCHCHIGYVHLDYLELEKVFGEGILERIPKSFSWSKPPI
ncbi:MAG: radical SAM/SPASM domain-containing protein [Candidatus Lokiarchaeota archaeon]|nr:radical SAM/SPASM domain-containing protein [Candidatus Lokiarchaeota archaeon]